MSPKQKQNQDWEGAPLQAPFHHPQGSRGTAGLLSLGAPHPGTQILDSGWISPRSGFPKFPSKSLPLSKEDMKLWKCCKKPSVLRTVLPPNRHLPSGATTCSLRSPGRPCPSSLLSDRGFSQAERGSAAHTMRGVEPVGCCQTPLVYFIHSCIRSFIHIPPLFLKEGNPRWPLRSTTSRQRCWDRSKSLAGMPYKGAPFGWPGFPVPLTGVSTGCIYDRQEPHLVPLPLPAK